MYPPHNAGGQNVVEHKERGYNGGGQEDKT